MLPFDDINYQDNIRLKYATKGKVRNLYSLSFIDSTNVLKESYNQYLVLEQSDRCSAFDYSICEIENKGYFLTQIAAFWFDYTRHIIENHYINHRYNVMLVKKYRPIKLEFIARGHITGSCWRGYKDGVFNISGETLPLGLTQNQRFTHKFPIITPTTKGEHDEPITPVEIVNQNYLTEAQLEFIYEIVSKLFNAGYKKCLDNHIIMADTKYEFGFDNNGSIVLIDEIHTPDSSRFWCLNSFYESQKKRDFSQLDNLDKDVIRNYLVSQGFPKTTKAIPPIPDSVVEIFKSKYFSITKRLLDIEESTLINDMNDYYTQKHKDISVSANGLIKKMAEYDIDCFNHNYFNKDTKFVVVVAGSRSDKQHTDKMLNILKDRKIMGGTIFMSAHKETQKVIDYIKYIDTNFNNVLWVTMAGMSNALSGVVAANSKFPTIGYPVSKNQTDLMLNMNATLQMPSNVPVMTILSLENIGLSCQRIFNLLN
jgi:phosphoribosylaminoimidazole-succinocarboxamide synthase